MAPRHKRFSFCPFCYAYTNSNGSYTYVCELQRCRKGHNWNGAHCCSIETKIMRPMWSKSSKHLFDSLHSQLSIEATEQFSMWQHYGCYWDFGNQYQRRQQHQRQQQIAIIFNKKRKKKCSGWKSCSFATFPNWMSFDDLRTNNGSFVIRPSGTLSLSLSFSITAQPICCFSIHLCYCNQIKWHSVSNLFILQYGKCDGAVACSFHLISSRYVRSHFFTVHFPFQFRLLDLSLSLSLVCCTPTRIAHYSVYTVHICSIKKYIK